MVSSKNHEFKEYVLDQLRFLERVECKPMFGGFGLYSDGVFFGIIAKGAVYFKTNAATVDAYKEKGMEAFADTEKLS